MKSIVPLQVIAISICSVLKRWMAKAYCGWIVFCILGSTLGCRVPSKDWNGIWKLNTDKSSYRGPVITISISSDGDYLWADGNVSYFFRCDGKFRPMGHDRMQACVKSSATVLDLTRKEKGEKTSAYHWELSSGGRVLTATATAFRSGDPVILSQNVALRMSGSDGFAGQWRDTSYLRHHADLTLKLDSRTLHIGYPDAEQYIDIPLDGVDAPVRGPGAPEGVTYAVRPSGQREFLIVTKHNGKAPTKESLELSNDGRTIIDSWWNPDRPDEKGTLVYGKK